MISRRLLRIKALMVLYAFNRKEGDDLNQAETELMFSIRKTYDLYHCLLLLILEISDVAREKIDLALQKKMPTVEDLKPNTRFIENKLVEQIRNNNLLKSYRLNNKISWTKYPEIPKILYNKMLGWNEYTSYMVADGNSYVADKKLIIKMVTDMFINSEDLNANLEEQSIYWNDDIGYVSAMIEKTLKRFRAESNETTPLMPLFKNEEDEQFVKILLRKSIINRKMTSEMIDKNTANWEVDRIALMDILVMQQALTEFIEFPEIPVKVTLNEYIEIAKYYCTSKSSTFVNGILDKVVKEMRESKFFQKNGRGLVGEN
jgi:N utilization substance protein B